jgi:hypothetical protein
MPRRVLGITAILVIAVVTAGGMAANLEVGVGTGPAVSLATTWDLSPNLVLGASFVVSYGSGLTQTLSVTLQTPSYTVGVFARFQFRLPASPISPYFGAAVQFRLYERVTSTVLTLMSGVRIDVNPNFYVLGEGTLIVPIVDIANWNWRIWFKAGFVFPF